VDAEYIRRTFGEKYLLSFLEISKEYIHSGALSINGTVYSLTNKGKQLADKISSEFFEE
jgi:hypothetical protein